MNSIVCSVTLIYLCLGNVAGLTGGHHWKHKPHEQDSAGHHWKHKPHEQDSADKRIAFIDSSEKNQNFKCMSKRKHDHQWYQVYPKGSQQQPIYVGNIPRQCKVKTTEYIIRFETFDIDTGIYCDNGSNDKEKTGFGIFHPLVKLLQKIWRDSEPSYKLMQMTGGTNKIYKDNEKPALLKYNEKKEVAFKCQKYVDKTNLVIGVINTTSNTIETFNKTFPDRIFNLSQNGTVLCCIYYEVNTEGSKSTITRHVTDKTLLVYDEIVTDPDTVRQDSSEENDNSTGKDDEKPDDDKGNQDADSGNQGSDSSNQEADSDKQDADSNQQEVDSGKKTADSSKQKPDSGKKDANSNKQDADSGNQGSDSSNQEADSDKQDADSNQQEVDTGKKTADSSKQKPDSGKKDANSSNQEADSGKPVADSSKQDDHSGNPATTIYIITAVAVVLILLVASVIYLKLCRKKPKVDMETKVLYADLDFPRRNEPESLPREGPQEESPYAQIIGEIRPK